MRLPLRKCSPRPCNAVRAGGQRRRTRRGVAAAEFAILAPFLGALIMGMCEMGRAVMVKDILTNAARKGCRTGASTGKTYQNAVDDVNNILSDNSISSGSATVTVQVASYTGSSTTPSWGSFTTVSSNAAFAPSALDKVSIKVAIPASSVLWFAPIFLPNTAIESETMIMVKQG
jgi:Flp pilus assembly protein TadG